MLLLLQEADFFLLVGPEFDELPFEQFILGWFVCLFVLFFGVSGFWAVEDCVVLAEEGVGVFLVWFAGGVDVELHEHEGTSLSMTVPSRARTLQGRCFSSC